MVKILLDPEEIIHFLVNIKAGADSFNPYSQFCTLHDRVNGALIRCQNLKLYLEAQIVNNPTSLWVAEAPSYKGMRRTGVPLVPENLLEYASRKLRTREKFSKATESPIQEVRTVNDVWEVISGLNNPPFLWNLVMLHSHRLGNSMSNRKPRQSEIELYIPLLRKLIVFLGSNK